MEKVYPEWGMVIKISLVSLWMSIPITIIGIIAKFVLSKLNIKSDIINKVINKIILIFFCLSLISRLIVEINIYNNHQMIFLIIGMTICMFVILLARNMRILSSKAFYIIILCILTILLITNDIYPHEYFDKIYIR